MSALPATAPTTFRSTMPVQAPAEPVYRSFEVEREEGVGAFRGLFFAGLLSLPVLGSIAGLIALVVRA